jgi:hypothetical protein
VDPSKEGIIPRTIMDLFRRCGTYEVKQNPKKIVY